MLRFDRRRRKRRLYTEDFLRYTPQTAEKLHLFEEAERLLVEDLAASDPANVPFLDFFERRWELYGPPVRRGLLAIYASENGVPWFDEAISSALERAGGRVTDTSIERFTRWSASRRGIEEHVNVAFDEWKELRDAAFAGETNVSERVRNEMKIVTGDPGSTDEAAA